MRRRVRDLFAVLALGAAAACSSATGGNTVGGGGNGGGAAAGGGSGGSAAGGGLLDGGGTGGNFGATCGADSYTGKLVPLDMFIMLDRSGSMQDDGKWGAVTGALTDFVGLPGLDDIGVGLGLFPTKPAVPPPVKCAAGCGAYGPCLLGSCAGSIAPNDSCIDSDYATPVVAMGSIATVASDFISKIQGTSPGGDSTPSTAALRGAMIYATPWAAAHPDHVTVVVLATDGEPNNCNPNDTAHVALAADVAFKGSPSVRTFVIGVGSQLTSLNQVAASGGTNKALIVDGSAGTGQQFLDALNEIRGAARCNYSIPNTGGDKPDFSRVNVAFTPAGGAEDVFPFVHDATACLGGPGWYYDNLASPSQIILCPSSCDVVTHQEGKVDVLIGCEQVIR